MRVNEPEILAFLEVLIKDRIGIGMCEKMLGPSPL